MSTGISTCLTVWMISASRILTTFGSDPAPLESKEYCHADGFNISCPKDHIIIMHTAHYGRMRVGKCVKEAHNDIGCYANVISHMDSKCSGYNKCSMPIPDRDLNSVHPCSKELMPYLEASYSCQKVTRVQAYENSCSGHAPVRLGVTGNTTRFLLLEPMLLKPAGKVSCDWLLSTEPGRRLNITLVNLHTIGTRIGGPTDEAVQCPYTAYTREGREALSDPHRICSKSPRETTLSTSKGQNVTLRLSRNSRFQDSGSETVGIPRFLIRVTPFGCADVDLKHTPNAHVTRNGDVTRITCNGDRKARETFFLSCSGSVWLGELRNCTAGGQVMGESPGDESGGLLPYSTETLLFIIGLGVAIGVAIGVVLLASILSIYHRRQKRKAACKALSHYTSDPLLSDGLRTEYAESKGSNYESRVCTLASVPRSPKQDRNVIYEARAREGERPRDPNLGAGYQTLPVRDNTTPQSARRSLPESPFCGCMSAGKYIMKNNNNQNCGCGTNAGSSTHAQTSFITFKPARVDAPGSTDYGIPAVCQSDAYQRLPNQQRVFATRSLDILQGPDRVDGQQTQQCTCSREQLQDT